MDNILFKHRWYPRLFPKQRYDTEALLYHHPLVTIVDRFIVLFSFNRQEYYTSFPTYADFLIYKENFKQEYRYFSEIILKEQPRKPFLTLSLDQSREPEYTCEDWESVLNVSIIAIMDILAECNVSIIPEKDIILISSGSEDKRNIRLIIDGYLHKNQEEAQLFHDRVFDRIPSQYRKFVAISQEKSIRRIPIIGCLDESGSQLGCQQESLEREPNIFFVTSTSKCKHLLIPSRPKIRIYKEKINRYIYIITDPDRESNNKYKVGYHSGDQKDLLARYITAIPELILKYFEPCINGQEVEALLKSSSKDIRITNCNGNLSEWYKCDYEDLLKRISKIQEKTTK